MGVHIHQTRDDPLSARIHYQRVRGHWDLGGSAHSFDFVSLNQNDGVGSFLSRAQVDENGVDDRERGEPGGLVVGRACPAERTSG